jgi:hypothetical protein
MLQKLSKEKEKVTRPLKSNKFIFKIKKVTKNNI